MDEVPRLQVRLQSNHRTRQKFSFSFSMILIVTSLTKTLLHYGLWGRPVAHLYKSKDMFFTHALTTKQVDALKDENSEIWESEERHWIVPRNLQKFKQHKIHDWPTRKRLHCSDYDPSLQNVNVAIDFSSVEHRDWWRWKVQSFKRQEIASYTWPSSTHQQNSKKRTIK